ncbi:MAG: FtsX-like permease family protein [Burkholderiaceae bacterium]|jgi:putative ABC transport system permease protein|nr:FtsX-like permease family protein [Burkholderiaceae bacterium]
MNLIVLALRNVLRNRRRSLITIVAVAVGLAAVGLFGGYIANVYSGLEAMAVSGERLGHLTVYKKGMLTLGKLKPKKYMFDASEGKRVEQALASLPFVKLVSPRLSISGIVSNGKASTIFIGEGVVAAHADTLRGSLPEGAGGRLDVNQSYGLAVSSDLADMLNFKKGDSMTLMTSTIDGQANAMDAQIIDVFNTGNTNTNDKYMLMPIGFAQSLLDTGSAERYVVLLDDIAKTESARLLIGERLARAGFDVEIKTWEELSSFYTSVRNLFNMIFSFIAFIVFIVAAMSIANTMAMTVVERTREIGTLRAMGMQRKSIVGMFVMEGVWLAAMGVLLGLAITLMAALAVNSAGISYVPPNSSYSVALLVDIAWSRIAIVSVVIVLLALASATLPAWRGARRNIVDALAFT